MKPRSKARKRSSVTIAELATELQSLVARHFELTAQHAPLHVAAHKQATASVGDPADLGRKWNAAYNAIMTQSGGAAIDRQMEETYNRIEKLRAKIDRRPVRGVADLRARVLIILHEMRPVDISHDGKLNFPNDYDGGATRALFDAAATLTGLRPFVARIERLIANEASARAKGGDA